MKCIKGYEIKVLQSGAGYYIGTTEDGFPYCRLSTDYYGTRAEAEQAMRELSFTPRVAVENIFCNGGAGCLRPLWDYEEEEEHRTPSTWQITMTFDFGEE